MTKIPVDVLMWSKYKGEGRLERLLNLLERRYNFVVHSSDEIGCGSIKGYMHRKHIKEVEDMILVSGVFEEKDGFELPLLPGEVGDSLEEPTIEYGCRNSNSGELQT